MVDKKEFVEMIDGYAVAVLHNNKFLIKLAQEAIMKQVDLLYNPLIEDEV